MAAGDEAGDLDGDARFGGFQLFGTEAEPKMALFPEQGQRVALEGQALAGIVGQYVLAFGGFR